MAVLHTNNASTTLAGSITSTATAFTVASGTGALFPNPSSPDYFMVTLVDSSNNIEIVQCTARATDVLTVVRAQEGTTARAYAAASKVDCRITAGAMANKLDKDTGGTVAGSVSVGGTLTAATSAVTGNQTVGGTQTVTGNSTIGSGNVTGNEVIGGNLNVGGVATVTGNANVGGALNVTGAATFAGGVTATITGNVTGNITGNQSGGTASPSNFTGMVAAFAMNTPPTGWLECNGAAVSRTTYAALFAALGTTFGAGDGSTTFNLPDSRGQFIRGWDHGAGVDTGRSFGTTQTDAMQGHYHSPLSGQTTFWGDGTGQGRPTGSGGIFTNTSTGSPITDGTNGTPRTAAESRPKNIALMYCIKT